jgi:hypothetical protein
MMKSINQVIRTPSVLSVVKKSFALAVIIVGIIVGIFWLFTDLNGEGLATFALAIILFTAVLYWGENSNNKERAAKEYALANREQITDCEVRVDSAGGMTCHVKLKNIREWIEVAAGPICLNLREDFLGIKRSPPAAND